MLLGKRAVHELFSHAQRAFYEEHAPKGLDLDDHSARTHQSLQTRFELDEGIDRKAVAELWFPDGTRILELSVKCMPDEAFHLAVATRAALARHGITLIGEQETKTRKALQDFSRLHGNNGH